MGALTNSSRGMDLGAGTYTHLGHYCGSLRCPCALRVVSVCVAEVAVVAAGVWDSVSDAQNVMVQVVNELVPGVVSGAVCVCSAPGAWEPLAEGSAGGLWDLCQ